MIRSVLFSRLLRIRRNLTLCSTVKVRGSAVTSNPCAYRFLLTKQRVKPKYTRYSGKAGEILQLRMAGSEAVKKNRLAREKSPYLLQHATNPVDWYPWGEEAFEKARAEDKLIFLSVGYSTCHWCHVMERESFVNEAIANIMNDNFVNIKVDREERPDVDKIYMTFVQATTGSGGWPMSVWLTPTLVPVYGGTYFPPDDRYFGQPGFKTVLTKIHAQWEENRQKFMDSGKKILDIISKHSTLSMREASGLPGANECVAKCMQQLSQHYEANFGGFSQAPKFPQPVNMNFLFSLYAAEPHSEQGKAALHMCLHTLTMMAMGGIYDHVGQGFARYSTDEQWHVPHFEKMLYDQGQLAVSYIDAYLASKEVMFADVARGILTYVSRDLSHKLGGFFSAEDADSYPEASSVEKKEGAFYVWTEHEIRSALHYSVDVLGKKLTLADIFIHHYDVKPKGNVDPYQDPHDELKNQNVLIVRGSEEETAAKFGVELAVVQKALKRSRDILYERRSRKPRPHLDDKIITAWNALMISGFAKAGQALDDETYVKRAIDAATFIKNHLYLEDDGTLLRSCYQDSDGNISQIPNPILGFADDYAYLIRALLDLYEACYDPSWIEWAQQLQGKLDELFWDSDTPGYFTSKEGDKAIVIRMKEDQDGAEPSANSVAVCNLLRLSTIFDNPDYYDRAQSVLLSFSERLKKVPVSLPEMTASFLCHRGLVKQIIVTGNPKEEKTKALLRVIHSHFMPNKVILVYDGTEDNFLYKNVDSLRRIKYKEGTAQAYVCHRFTCAVPVCTPTDLARLLEDESPPGEEDSCEDKQLKTE